MQSYSQCDSFPATAPATGTPWPPSRAFAAASAAPTCTAMKWTQVRLLKPRVLFDASTIGIDLSDPYAFLPFIAHPW